MQFDIRYNISYNKVAGALQFARRSIFASLILLRVSRASDGDSIVSVPGPEAILFSRSAQLNMKFQMLISRNIKKFSFFQAQISLECYFSYSYMLLCRQLLAF